MSQKSGQLKPLGLRLREGDLFLRHLFIKQHRGAQAGSALFISGLPAGMDEAMLAYAMSCFGEVEQAVLHPSKVGF